MALTKEDLDAIKSILEKALEPLKADISELKSDMRKVLKCVATENADFDASKKNGKTNLFIQPQEEA